MILVSLVLFIAVIGIFLRTGLIEFSIGALMVSPLVWQVFVRLLMAVGLITSAPTGQAGVAGYLMILGVVLLIPFFVLERRSPRDIRFSDILPLVLWSLSFTIALYYCHSWPDFYQSGERLRDYALLAASVNSPIVPVEPWMSTATINYYIYWYRFGHMLSTLGGYPVWELYHLLVAFSIATYLTMLFRVMTRLLRLGSAVSLIASVAIAFGSNIKGILDWIHDDHGWWGPSRVIKGAINEFPAWSFLLGDLHPHYVNLSTIPFLLLLLGSVWSTSIAIGEKCLYAVLIALIGHVFLFGSNAWEIPMWWGILGALLVVITARPDSPLAKSITTAVREWWSSMSRKEAVFAVSAIVSAIALLGILIVARGSISKILGLGLAVIIVSFAILFIQPKIFLARLMELREGVHWNRVRIVSLSTIVIVAGCILGSRHIVPEGGALRLVRSPIELTNVGEMFLHWGIPLSLIALCTPLLMNGLLVQIVTTAAIAVTLLLNDGALLIFFLAFLQLPRIARDDSKALLSAVFGNALVLAGLGLVLLPEFVFLDDPYGGENERMNTIFKIYTTAWFLMHVGAAYMVYLVITKFFSNVSWAKDRRVQGAAFILPTSAMFVMLGFFNQTIDLRRIKNEHLEPYTRGLSEVARLFPGSKETIDFLTNQRPTVVLEAQGNAYDYTSFVSTLSGQTAFLGWSNHVGLLTKRYDEVGRREKVTESFYTSSDCTEKKGILERENIGVVVVGALEKKKYPSSNAASYSCLAKIFEQGDYVLYQP